MKSVALSSFKITFPQQSKNDMNLCSTDKLDVHKYFPSWSSSSFPRKTQNRLTIEILNMHKHTRMQCKGFYCHNCIKF